jgi:hypothetical protein
MRCVRQEHVGQRTWGSADTCPMGCDTIPPILLTALPSYEPVTCHLRRCEKRLRAGKPATSYWKSASVSMRAISLEGPRVPCSARCRHRLPACSATAGGAGSPRESTGERRALAPFCDLSRHRYFLNPLASPLPESAQAGGGTCSVAHRTMVSTAGCSHDLAGQTISPATWTTGDAP